MLCANLCVICGIWYVVCSVLYATCPDPYMIYPFCYVACLKAFMLSKYPFVCLNSFIKWAKIALALSIFVASSLLCCICIYAQGYVALAKLYVALANSPFDLYWFIFRHDLSLGSNVHKVLYELNIHKLIFTNQTIFFTKIQLVWWFSSRVVVQ